MPTSDLNWLAPFVKQLQKVEPVTSTLFDILKVATRETTNSNLLAYYLDERNPHGLGRLFLDSLINCMSSAHSPISLEQCLSPYTVERETNNIDILIQEEAKNWAIILENKIFHTLNNPLGEYWASVKCVNEVNKYGVVVSLKKLSITDEHKDKFVSVTHMAWLTKVKEAMATGEAGAHSDIRHQLVFDDFFLTMMTNTATDSNDLEKNKAISIFQQYKEDINRLLAQQSSLQTYVQRHIDAIFGEHNFSRRSSQFYYLVGDKPDSGIRFFVENKILMDNTLGLYLELYGEALKNGDIIRDEIAPYLNGLGLRFDEHQNLSIYHLAITTNKAVLTADNDLLAILQQEINKFFTPVADQQSLVVYCTSLLAKEMTPNESV